ncbi:MAG: metal-dependent hydrolase [Kiritimatiellae bacterium]|nr:metal-dependent hydrolase [Kiritimatiellia bacterium]
MPSPIVHAALGTGAALAMLPRKKTAVPAAFALVALSCWPDIDYVPGLLAGALNRFHQGPSHSLVFVFLGVLLAYPFVRHATIGRLTRANVFLLLLGVGLSHLLLDIFTQDFRPPIGIPLLWPLTDEPVHSSFSLFPAWAKGTLAEIVTSPRNLRAIGIELLYAIPLLVLPPLLMHHRKKRG